MRWKASWSGLSGPITAVAFYGPAPSGKTAQPTAIWPAPFGLTYEGRVTLTPRKANDLLASRWYVNISTAAHPEGEIRGQLQQVAQDQLPQAIFIFPRSATQKMSLLAIAKLLKMGIFLRNIQSDWHMHQLANISRPPSGFARRLKGKILAIITISNRVKREICWL